MSLVRARWRRRQGWWKEAVASVRSRRNRNSGDALANASGNVTPETVPIPPQLTTDRQVVGRILPAWYAEMPYLQAIRTAQDPYDEYLEQRNIYGDLPYFYMDCGDVFIQRHDLKTAMRVLSNLAEKWPRDPAKIRLLANYCQKLRKYERAVALFRGVAAMCPNNPQSFRDLGLALADHAELAVRERNRKLAKKLYTESLAMMEKVVMTNWWKNRDIEQVALTEWNAIYKRARRSHPGNRPPTSLRKNLEADLRVVLSWDTERTNLDLELDEPGGTANGQRIVDCSVGLGPEEYVIPKAVTGRYKVRVVYNGHTHKDHTVPPPVTVRIDVFTNFGRPGQLKRTVFKRISFAKNLKPIDITDIVLSEL